MAAPSRPSTGRRLERQPSLSTRRARTHVVICGVMCGLVVSLAGGCAWWKEARDSLTYSQILYRKALESEARGEHDEAARMLRDSIAASPDDAELRWELARLLLNMGHTSEALQELRFLVRHYPDDNRAYMSLAKTLLERGRPEDAARLADLAIDLDSHSVEALMLRAQIAEVRQDFELARDTYHQILREQPDLAHVRLCLARVELEHGDTRIAAASLREMLANQPLTPEQNRAVNQLLGTCYARQGRWTDAAESLTRGLDPDNASEAQRYELAYACFQAGRHDQARDELATVLRSDPQNQVAQDLLVELATQPIQHTAAQQVSPDESQLETLD